MAVKKYNVRHVSMPALRTMRVLVRCRAYCLGRTVTPEFVNKVALHLLFNLYPNEITKLVTATNYVKANAKAMRLCMPFFEEA